MPKKRLKDVPKDKVGEKVQDFINFDDASEVTAQEEQKNKWTVEAEIPE